jgi:hypothetical protein
MKKAIVIVALAFAVVALMGCASVNYPHSVGSASIEKTGQSQGQIILGLFGTADAGIATAAKNAGITKIATVDVQIKPLLGGAGPGFGYGLVVTYITTVTGE